MKRINIPNIEITDYDFIPRIDTDNPDQENLDEISDYITKRFENRPLTSETVEEIKETMRQIGLDPDAFVASFDKDTGELLIKPNTSDYVAVDFIVRKDN